MSDTCPYCRRAYSSENPPTDDHVFLDSLGGHATIPACKECNNDTFGSKVEGALQARGTWGGFLRGKRFDATPSTGSAPVEVDPSNQTFRSKRPVGVDRSEAGRVGYRIQGSEQQVGEILRGVADKHGLSDDDIESILDGARTTEIESLETTLEFDLSLAERSAAKMALGAMVLARGAEAMDCELAESLRSVAFGTAGDLQGARINNAPLDCVNSYLVDAGEEVDPVSSSATFIGLEGNRTVVYVSVQGNVFPPQGVVLPGTLPRADLIATVVVDSPGLPRVVGVATAMAAAAQAEADEGTG